MPFFKELSAPVSSDRIIFHVDLDYFFAQCEEIRNPDIKGKPVIICVYSGRSENSGAVSTTNYEAREYGVKSGIPIRDAQTYLKDVESIFLPVDREYYEAISIRIMSTLKDFAIHFENTSIDEAYLDVGKIVNYNYQTSERYALHIKNKIKIIYNLTCSIGIGPNKIISKIASNYKKPNAITLIPPKKVIDFLNPLSITKLPGIGTKYKNKLKKIEVNQIQDLREVKIDTLQHMFGVKLGLYFYLASRGIHNEKVIDNKKFEQISRIITLKENTRDEKEIVNKINGLSLELYTRIQKEKIRYKSIGVIVFMDDLTIHTRSKTLDTYSDDFNNIFINSKELIKNLLNETSLKIRRLGIKIFNLEDLHGQKTLLDFINK